MKLAWVVSACAVMITVANAQPASSAAQAEALFKRGKDLLAQGKTPEACAAFDASQKLDPTVTTRLNQANCREKNGQLASAWGHFLEAERDARALGTADAKQLQKVASTRAAALEKRVSTLQINVPEQVTKLPGFECFRNRDAVDPASLNAPLPIDGGTYTIAIRTLRSREWTTTISIANEKDAKSVEVPIIVEDKQVSTPPPSDTKEEPEPRPTPEVQVPEDKPGQGPMVRPTMGGVRYAAIAIGVIGVGGIAFGAVRGLSAQSKQDDAQRLCPDPMMPCANAATATQLTHDGHAHATQANLGFAIGGGLVATGVILWFVGRPSARPATDVAITPSIDADGASVSLSGAW